LPRDRYEALLEVYQAQNAVQIAASVGAAEYAPDTFAKAQDQLRQAQELQRVKDSASSTVTMARQAAQTAEDARTIALRRKQDSDLTAAQQQQVAAEVAARQARDEAASLRAQLEQERAARDQADREIPAPPAPPEPPPVFTHPAQPVPETPSSPPPEPASGLRMDLYRQFGAVCETRDTPRGLVITLPDAFFHGPNLNSASAGKLASLGAILRAQAGLMVVVEGYTDDRGDASADERLSYARANAVRSALIGHGPVRNSVSARGWGKSRPVASNATAEGREENRRVEIVVSGPALGTMAGWERSYSVMPR
jgi:outer membrane protein OmpA-like peptidoglycan-associated protein